MSCISKSALVFINIYGFQRRLDTEIRYIVPKGRTTAKDVVEGDGSWRSQLILNHQFRHTAGDAQTINAAVWLISG
jgi:hypothetical protein